MQNLSKLTKSSLPVNNCSPALVDWCTEWLYRMAYTPNFRNQILFNFNIKFSNINNLCILVFFQAKKFHETLIVDVCIEKVRYYL